MRLRKYRLKCFGDRKKYSPTSLQCSVCTRGDRCIKAQKQKPGPMIVKAGAAAGTRAGRIDL